MDLSQPGPIAIAVIKGSDDLLILSSDRMRSVRVTRRGIGELVGKPANKITKKDALVVAPELLQKPSLAYGRFEMIEELHDADRAMFGHTDPTEEYGKHSEEWKEQGDGQTGSEGAE